MSLPSRIELIRVVGDRRDVGRQIGEACSTRIKEEVASIDADLPEGRTLAEQMELAAAYRAATLDALPWLIDETDAIAEAAGVDAVALFSTGVEEIWYAPRLPKGRCSDMVAGPRATANGHLIVGHNNDLYPKHEAPLIAIERTVTASPPCSRSASDRGRASDSTARGSLSPGTSCRRTTRGWGFRACSSFWR